MFNIEMVEHFILIVERELNCYDIFVIKIISESFSNYLVSFFLWFRYKIF